VRVKKKTAAVSMSLSGVLMLLTVFGAGAANAQGWRQISSGTAKYDSADFEGAIRCFQQALSDGVTYRESVNVYCYLGACSAKLNEPAARDAYFVKVLSRDATAQLPSRLVTEFSGDFEKTRDNLAMANRRQLTVTSEPVGARIMLGGSDVGVTPKTFPLTVGENYSVAVGEYGYKTWSTSIHLDRDTSLTFKLLKEPDTVWTEKRVYLTPKTGVRTYMIGVAAGAGLGLVSYLASAWSDDQARVNLRSYASAGDTASAREYFDRVQNYHTAGNVLFYASYPLMAVGFFAGLRLAQRFLPEYTVGLDESRPTSIYCSLDKNLNLTLGVRRSIW